MAKKKMRQVEYFRCWPGNEGDRGTWDTDYIAIPAETPDDKIEDAIREAAAKIKWPNEVPSFVGLYCDGGPEEEDEGDGEQDDLPSPETEETPSGEMSKRKFYKSTFAVEVLSEEPLSGSESLADLSEITIEGDCSGSHKMTKTETLNGKQAAEALQEQGSDPEFFRLTEDGKDLEDE